MTSATGVWLVAAAVFAVANWWSRWSQHRPTELWSKPLTLVALIGAAIAVDPIDPTVRAWFVVALVLSLAGDVFLLGDDRWFVPGLAAFLAGHVAYVVGFVLAEPWRWWSFALAWIGLVRPRASRSAGASSRERSTAARRCGCRSRRISA